MKTAITFFSILFMCFQGLKAQQPTFSKTYGDSSNASVYSIREVENDGFLLFGARSHPFTGSSEQALIKTDSAGNEEIIKYFGAPDFRYHILFEQEKNNEFVTLQVKNETRWDSVRLKKLDKDFKVLSSKDLPLFTDSFWNGFFSTINYLPEHGFLVSGQSKGNQSDFYLFLMDENGNIKWHLAPSQSTVKIQYISTIKQIGNNILLMGSGLFQNQYGTFIIQIDKSGFEVSSYHFTSSPGNEVVGSNVVLQPDGNLLFTGHKNKSGGISGIMLVKFNTDLDTIWTKYLASEKVDPKQTDGSQFGAASTAATQDGGLVMIINDVNRFGTLHDYVAKFDKSGNFLWSYHLDSNFSTTYYTIIETLDGGIALAGTKNGYFHFLKLNAQGTQTAIRNENLQINKIKIYPNPAVNEIYISLNNNSFIKTSIEFFDISGKLVKTLDNLSGNNHVLQREDLKAGIYLLKIKDNKGNNYQEKLILN